MTYIDRVGVVVVDKSLGKMILLIEYANKKDETWWKVYQTIWGKREWNETDVECLCRETREEINCDINAETLAFLGEYVWPSVSDPMKNVVIRLYQWELMWDVQPQVTEGIVGYVRMGKEVMDYPECLRSHVLREKILPDLIKRRIIW